MIGGVDVFGGIVLGFGVALTPMNIFFCLAGCLIGTLVGVLPGLGPTATIAILLPMTFGLPPRDGPHNACRHLLRCPIRWLDDVHPAETSGRSLVGRHSP